MGMIWKGTHVFIKGLTAENAQSKNQSPEVKRTACRVQKQVCVEPHIWGRVQKKFCCIEGSQNHVLSVNLNGRRLKQPGLFLELASWPNWAIDGEGLWLDWWPTTWWSLYLSSMIICGDRRSLQKDKHHCNTPPIWALRRCGQTQSSPQWRHMKTHGNCKKKQKKT